MTIYLDNNATTPLRPEVLEAMLPYLKENYGNPSSVYQLGQTVRKAIEEAREQMAAFIGADDPNEIIFTSGATEANNAALKGVTLAYRANGNRVISSAIEHSSVRNVLKHLERYELIENIVIPVSSTGIVDVTALKDAFTKNTVLVSVMAANNEIGTLQPIKEISAICKEKNVVFHTDAVQLAGKTKINVNDLGVDLLSLSAHKFGGPKGVGILYVRKGTRMEALIHGGTHEKNRRGGTENAANIIGMGKAAQLAVEEKKLKTLRDMFEEKILKTVPQSFINGDRENRISNTTNICFECTDSSSLLMALDLKGVSCSNGSACATGTADPSHVLLAMGLPQDKAHASLRFSLGHETTEHDITQAAALIAETVAKLRETHPLWKSAV